MIHESILQTIGETPIVEIKNLNPNPAVSIFAKIEGRNPTGSIKDRIALKMLEMAEADGTLTKGKTIIEATSGNTGIALAMIGAIKGYKVEIVMSETVSIERHKMIKAFGGSVLLTKAENGTDGAIQKVKELIAKFPNKYFTTDQFSNKYNRVAHYKTTGEEIWKQLNGKIDYLVSAIGTSGTIMGVGKVLKEYNPNIKIVCAEPVEGHYIQGLKNMKEAIIPAIYDPAKIDMRIMVDTEIAFDTTRDIVKKEGIFCGMSSGAALYAAIELAKIIDSGRIVTIFPDRGEKYLSTDLYKI